MWRDDDKAYWQKALRSAIIVYVIAVLLWFLGIGQYAYSLAAAATGLLWAGYLRCWGVVDFSDEKYDRKE
jgi:hypothetical protein